MYAVDRGVDVLSISLGAEGADALEAAAIGYVRSHGVLVIAAAGNSNVGTLTYPAVYDSVLAVGATTNDGTTKAPFANLGSWVAVGAPGENMPVALPDAADTDDVTVDGYSRWDGTSFSAPLVAGERRWSWPITPPQPREPWSRQFPHPPQPQLSILVSRMVW